MGCAGLALPARRAEVQQQEKEKAQKTSPGASPAPRHPVLLRHPVQGGPGHRHLQGWACHLCCTSPQKRSTSCLLNVFKKQEEKTGEEKTVQSNLYFLPQQDPTELPRGRRAVPSAHSHCCSREEQGGNVTQEQTAGVKTAQQDRGRSLQKSMAFQSNPDVAEPLLCSFPPTSINNLPTFFLEAALKLHHCIPSKRQVFTQLFVFLCLLVQPCVPAPLVFCKSLKKASRNETQDFIKLQKKINNVEAYVNIQKLFQTQG